MQAAAVPLVPALAINRILYATDFSSASKMALPLVSALARRYHAEVYLANVRSPLPYTMATPEAVCVLERKRETEALAEMEELLHSPELQGIAATSVIESGDPAEELKRAVHDHNIDLAVAGTHGRTGLMRLLLGSIAEELFRNLPCPVITVGPRSVRRLAPPEGRIHTLLCPTDLSAQSRAAFPYAASIAAEYQARIILLHTVSARNALSSIALETASLARREVQKMFCPHIDSRCDVEIVVDFGDPVERILACAVEYEADLIAFGVRKANEASTHFRNTVAYRVVLNAECPVLTCRST